MPLVNYAAETRCSDPGLLRAVLAAAMNSCTVEELARILRAAGFDNEAGRATLAWMLKYDLLFSREPPASANGTAP